jgi:hypothetical protein
MPVEADWTWANIYDRDIALAVYYANLLRSLRSAVGLGTGVCHPDQIGERCGFLALMVHGSILART